jgi:hypothetical protein
MTRDLIPAWWITTVLDHKGLSAPAPAVTRRRRLVGPLVLFATLGILAAVAVLGRDAAAGVHHYAGQVADLAQARLAAAVNPDGTCPWPFKIVQALAAFSPFN